MKKNGILCLLFVLSVTVLSAAADSVWTPMDDYFMETWNPENESTCEYQDRQTYMAAGEDGYVTAVKTPLDHWIVNTYPNGTEFMISFMCGIGNDQWGTIRAVRLPGEKVFTEDYTGTSGYIHISELVRAFDTDSFVDLNFNSIYGYADDFDPCDPKTPFVIWSYPNSGVQLSIISEDTLDWFCHEFTVGSEYFPIIVDRYYVEPNGSRWLSVQVTKPNTYGWINAAYPMAGAINTEN